MRKKKYIDNEDKILVTNKIKQKSISSNDESPHTRFKQFVSFITSLTHGNHLLNMNLFMITFTFQIWRPLQTFISSVTVFDNYARKQHLFKLCLS